jgi:hypothetical protein
VNQTSRGKSRRLVTIAALSFQNSLAPLELKRNLLFASPLFSQPSNSVAMTITTKQVLTTISVLVSSTNKALSLARWLTTCSQYLIVLTAIAACVLLEHSCVSY